MKQDRHLITIDAQKDFCDPRGSLFVAGADDDMKRLAAFIQKYGEHLNEIHATLDSHQTIHIAHPIFWINSQSQHPKPFTLITRQDVQNGTWRTTEPRWQARAQHYVDELDKHGRYILCIWPPHCRIGSWGHSLVDAVSDALYDWEEKTFSKVDFVAKGSNFFTEHYSAVQADVPDDSDPTTKLNTELIDMLSKADEIFITGEALSHCVANSICDVADSFGDENIKKFILLEDTSSNVGSFEKMGEDFVLRMKKRGMKIAKSTDF